MIIQAPSLICAEKLNAEIRALRAFHGEPVVAGEFPTPHKSGLFGYDGPVFAGIRQSF